MARDADHGNRAHRLSHGERQYCVLYLGQRPVFAVRARDPVDRAAVVDTRSSHAALARPDGGQLSESAGGWFTVSLPTRDYQRYLAVVCHTGAVQHVTCGPCCGPRAATPAHMARHTVSCMRGRTECARLKPLPLPAPG